jgi:CubicO group peptidase (beta-lactamase class C family)
VWGDPPPPPVDEAPRYDAELAEALQPVLELARIQLNAPGVVLGVELPDGRRWVGAAGLSDVAGDVGTRPEDAFRIGSVTKTFTASAVLQLTAEGAISLDDTLAHWLPGLVPNEELITIELLLQHRSGIRSYTDTAYFVGHLTEPTTPLVMVQESVAEGAEFAPGTGGVVSTADDLMTWLRALLEGDVLGPDERALMRTDTGDGYGMGMYVRAAPEGLYLGHTGGTQGFRADLFRLETSGVIVTALVNDYAVDASDVSARAWEVLND